jgi:hypothetical protein
MTFPPVGCQKQALCVRAVDIMPGVSRKKKHHQTPACQMAMKTLTNSGHSLARTDSYICAQRGRPIVVNMCCNVLKLSAVDASNGIHPAKTADQVGFRVVDGLRAHFLASLSTAWARASASGSVGSKWPPAHSSLSACSSWSGSAIASRNSL